jgi:hypothetical protein
MRIIVNQILREGCNWKQASFLKKSKNAIDPKIEGLPQVFMWVGASTPTHFLDSNLEANPDGIVFDATVSMRCQKCNN